MLTRTAMSFLIGRGGSSVNEKNPSDHDIRSKTTVSICCLMNRSMSRRDNAVGDENLADASLVAGALHRGGARQICRRRLAGSLENRSEEVRVTLHRRGDDGAGVEVDAALVVPLGRVHAQGAGLSAQVEQRKDVVDAELAEWAFDRH